MPKLGSFPTLCRSLIMGLDPTLAKSIPTGLLYGVYDASSATATGPGNLLKADVGY